jgi:glycosyltransferase involved in cell wall biosynthesis
MVGDGPLSAEVERRIGVLELENEVRRIARITREEMPQIYAAADFLVVTSDVEGMPLAVLEAMAMDCPVASTDVGGVRSFVGYDKLSMLVPSSQPLLLADKLAALLASTEDKSHAVHPSPRSVVLEKGGTLRAMLASYNLIVHALCAQSNRISEPGKQS